MTIDIATYLGKGLIESDFNVETFEEDQKKEANLIRQVDSIRDFFHSCLNANQILTPEIRTSTEEIVDVINKIKEGDIDLKMSIFVDFNSTETQDKSLVNSECVD